MLTAAATTCKMWSMLSFAVWINAVLAAAVVALWIAKRQRLTRVRCFEFENDPVCFRLDVARWSFLTVLVLTDLVLSGYILGS